MKNEKTKYKGVYLDTKTGKYSVQTTFTTKDGYHIKKCKRGFETAKKAELWKTQTALEYSNTYYTSTVGCKKGLELLIDEYLNQQKSKLKPTTIISTEIALKKSLSNYISVEAKELNMKIINAIYNDICNSDVTAETKNLRISKVRKFFMWLDLMEYIDASVYRKSVLVFEKLDTTEKKIVVAETEEIQQILDYFADDENKYVYHIFLTILAYTGCRCGECRGLKYSDINLQTNVITIERQAIDLNIKRSTKDFIYKLNSTYIFPYTKTNSIKEVVVPEHVIDKLLEYKEMQNASDDDYIFQCGKKGFLSKVAINKILTKACELLDIKTKITPHSFRHYHTTMLYEMGCDASYVKERLGHASETTSLNTYKHISKNRRSKNDDIISKMVI